MHREGCPDEWYDLSGHVPRFVEGTQTRLTKTEVLQLLFAVYTTEKARRAQFQQAAQLVHPPEGIDIGPIVEYQDNAHEVSLLFRLRFPKRPTVLVDFGNGRDVGVHGIKYTMQNGLRLSYRDGLLDFHGIARQPATFHVTGVQGAFRLTIDRDVVDINGSHIFTAVGLTLRQRTAQSERAKYAITLVGG